MPRPKCYQRDDVLDKATQLFWKKGYADTSLKDLEACTGVNKSGLYTEFKNKEDLLIACLRRYHTEGAWRSVLSKSPLGHSNLSDFLIRGTECAGQKGCFFANTLRDAQIIPQAALDIIQENNAEIFQMVVENVKAASLKTDPEKVANLILTFGAGLSLKLNMIDPLTAKREVLDFISVLKTL